MVQESQSAEIQINTQLFDLNCRMDGTISLYIRLLYHHPPPTSYTFLFHYLHDDYYLASLNLDG